MRDIIVVAIILGSVPVCFVNPFVGVLMWYWVTYFNPHRFTWSYAYDFPAAAIVAAPTLVGTLFAKKSLRSLFTQESVLLLLLWAWFGISYVHAQGIPLFAESMPDAAYEIGHISKILLFTFVMIVLITTRERIRWVLLVTGGSLGLLAIKGTLFGLRTGGEFRVLGPPDSFLAENNAFGLALNMSLPILFYLARGEKKRWMRIGLWVAFACAISGVLLTYSRGDLLGLAVVLTAILMKTRHKLIGGIVLAGAAFLIMSFAPGAWMERMSRFMEGNIDASAEQRLVSWGTAWNLAHDFPITGGSFDVLPNVNVFQRYQPRPLPLGYKSSGPHSIYFQFLADQGFVGLGLFLLLIGCCFWTLHSVRRRSRRLPSANWIVDYTHMVEIALLAFLTSGAFLGFAYLDLIYQMIGTVVVLKMLFRQEVRLALQEQAAPQPAAILEVVPEGVSALS